MAFGKNFRFLTDLQRKIHEKFRLREDLFFCWIKVRLICKFIFMNLNLYTDGSCIGNPGPGGWGFVFLENGKIFKKDSGGEAETTNNRMEIQAVIEGLKYILTDLEFEDAELKIYSDSRLLISTMNENWKRKKNLDLWNILDLLLIDLRKKTFKISWHWVKAHNGNLYNEMVDKIALKEAEKFGGRMTKVERPKLF